MVEEHVAFAERLQLVPTWIGAEDLGPAARVVRATVRFRGDRHGVTIEGDARAIAALAGSCPDRFSRALRVARRERGHG